MRREEITGGVLKDLAIFDFKAGSSVRATFTNNEPWFVAKDICSPLAHSNHRKAVSDLVEEEDQAKLEVKTKGGNQQLLHVNESGVYALIFGSRVDGAKEFKRWIRKEVLPSIRKHGHYSTTGNWEKARVEGKEVRNELTSVIATFIDYATKQGSKSAHMYYVNLSRMVNSQLLEFEKKPRNVRDKCSTIQLHIISVAELIVMKTLCECMSQGLSYKDIFQIAKSKISEFAGTVGKTPLGYTNKQIALLATS